MPRPGYLNPFILDVASAESEVLTDHADLYLPDGPGPFPVVVLVPGMLREPPEIGPRGWPVFEGYAGALVARGVAAVVMDHDLSNGPDYPRALAEAVRTLDAATARPEVDSDRAAFWVFSAGGPLALALLAGHADRFGLLALTYPFLESEPLAPWPSREEAVAALDGHRLVVTTVGQEFPDFVPGQQAFLAAARAARADLEELTVRGGAHGFDSQEPTEDGRKTVTQAIAAVASHLLDA
ncbi:alpha/beta hydrolase family protein [Ornithinimicrobium faecis]|uniref:alpha/beta hydrolase family protein n=1 Tax=Ornithinimicrobium faecis TaxID=2934158 RepID=UPI00211961EB|nr:hypothetical protein [Ornithinimicrobium sp. HY1745]